MSHPRAALLVLVMLAACKPEEHGETSTSSTADGTGSTTIVTGQPTDGSSSSGSVPSTGAPGDACESPEHQAFRDALCPFQYPDCTPNLPLEVWASYCADAGFGPVGSGECSCTPKAVECATGPDTSEISCCCPLEDLE